MMNLIQKKQINTNKDFYQTSSIEKIAGISQIKENDFLNIKPSLKKLNSSIFQKDHQQISDICNLSSNHNQNAESQNIQKQVYNLKQQRNNFQRNNNSFKIYSPKRSNILNKSTQNDSNSNISQIICRYRSSTLEEQRKKNSEFFSTPNKKIKFKNSQTQLNHSSSTSSFLTQQPNGDKQQVKKILQRSQTSQNLNSSLCQSRQSSVGIKKDQQCLLIKSAFTLLPNNLYLPLDDDKIITIRTPNSSLSDSSASDEEQIIKDQNQVEKMNESSKQFLKNFLRERRQQEKQNQCVKMSNQVRQIQQTILNKVLNEMNKEKESNQIIKNLEVVKYAIKNKKKLTKEDFDPLIHYRPKDNFCKNKKIILKLNNGIHPPKDITGIAREQQEGHKNFIIPCQKQNFFGSEYRRMLNRGVPQIVKDLQNFRQ